MEIKKMRIKRRNIEKIVGLLFVSPFILGFLIFTLYPFAQAVQYSFSTVRFLPTGITQVNVGFDNYINVLFKNPEFLLQLPNYLRQLVFLVPMVLVFSILLALLLNTKLKFRSLFRAIFFLPVIIISGPVVEMLRGIRAMEIRGLEYFPVYEFMKEEIPSLVSSPIIFIFDNVITFLWFSGVQILIFLSGLQKVDRSIYEAASVDGASTWQKFWKITMPVLKPFFFLNGVYTIVDISNSSINPVIGLIRAGMFEATRGFGYSAAMTWLYFFVIVIGVIICYLLVGRPEKISKKYSGTFRRTH